ncbi:hypothetical protein CGRA01v4_00049 [Colletotrichum graminicola]|nr:hypothetical protein CGRA01v4_00049 [Colletotrichum graminicola]
MPRKSIDEDAVQTDGRNVKDGKGNNMKISQIKAYTEKRSRTANQLSTNTKTVSEADGVPIRPGRVDAGPCHDGNVKGYTQPYDPFPYIVLCPSAFGLRQSSKGNNWSYRPFQLATADRPSGREIGTVARVDDGDVEIFRKLRSIAPMARTFLHELFHLVHGNSGSYPKGGGEVYQISAILKASYSVSNVNPETYAQMAIAAANTLDQQNDGMDLNWHTGYATRDEAGGKGDAAQRRRWLFQLVCQTSSSCFSLFIKAIVT